MAPLTDPVRLRAYKNALANWRFEGFVNWKEVAAGWVRRELEGLTTKAVARLMFQYVDAGGAIDQQRETRNEWSEHKYHYDLRLPIGNRQVYIETLLDFDSPEDPDDPQVYVVSIHDA